MRPGTCAISPASSTWCPRPSSARCACCTTLGILNRHRVGNLVNYSANADCPILPELQLIASRPSASRMCCARPGGVR